MKRQLQKQSRKDEIGEIMLVAAARENKNCCIFANVCIHIGAVRLEYRKTFFTAPSGEDVPLEAPRSSSSGEAVATSEVSSRVPVGSAQDAGGIVASPAT